MDLRIIEASSPYEFDTDQNGFPTFTQKNIDFLNGILRYDSNYSMSSDKNNPEYQSSYAGILERGDFFDFSAPTTSGEYDELELPIDNLYRVIESIDKINSTHLSSEGNSGKSKTPGEKRNKGRAKVAKSIRQLGGESLKEILQKGDARIIDIIADSAVGGKYNFSFATKFCSYVSIHALKLDNYCIYDEILQLVLPYYAYMYIDNFDDIHPNLALYKTIKATKSNGYISRNESLISCFKQNKNYDGYRDLIKEILAGIKKKIGVEIKYADFDHMVWYYFKGSKNKIINAINCLPKKN